MPDIPLNLFLAIGYTTNLIARDSNVIIVRNGADFGEERSTYSQLRQAVEDFFPLDGILERESVRPPSAVDLADIMRRRSVSSSGLSELVGRDNGERPGGFVLVIDGSSLTRVIAFHLALNG